jgi:CheY-like chemotaxis protein
VKTRLLVVEDNEFSREMLCDWLELQGFVVDSATNLADAYFLVKKAPPAAVLLDVQLGPEDGLTLAAWLRQKQMYCHIPIIAVTAHAMVAEQDRILQSGCNACISKPVDFDSLRAQLNRWLAIASLKTSSDGDHETVGPWIA